MESKKRLTTEYSKQLGMSAGSAAHQLTRILLFGYIQRNNENICYRCGSVIETFAEFSIEHKEPWRNVSSELFWDLNNVAFSHKVCNTRAARHVGKRIIGDAGTSWCSCCKRFHPVGCFANNRAMWNGLHRTCKKCQKERREKAGLVYGLCPSLPS